MKKTILLIEDAPDTAKILKATLDKDYHFIHAKDLTRARKELYEFHADLILLDANLPDGDGFSFCTWLQKDARYRDIPVVFLTGRSDPQEKTYALEMGAKDYLTKPVQPKLLRAQIEALIQRYSQAA